MFSRRVAPICVWVLVAGILAPALQAAEAPLQFLQGLRQTDYHFVESPDIGRGFHIYVRTPDGYDAEREKGYPTVYVLDGGALFPLLSAYYGYLRGGQEVPELIIVGISYGSENFAGGNYRSTDYTAPAKGFDYWGGAAGFQQFLRTELIPDIERRYRSDATRRILFGQSLGGQFVLFSAQTAPQLFWGHIASNPALNRNLDFFLADLKAGADDEPATQLFVSSATEDDPQFRQPAVAWIDHWNKQSHTPWRLKTVHLPGHTHNSAPPAAFRQGMRWLFPQTPNGD